MTYAVKEIFLTLQGEGAHAGKTAVFCRFTGCNLWSGQEKDRATSVCKFCDTDFVGMNGVGGGKFKNAEAIAQAIQNCWGDRDPQQRFVVFTGGEPLLQLDHALIQCIKQKGFYIAIETNGTFKVPQGIDWICVSPKVNVTELLQDRGDELKLVYPQSGVDPEHFVHLNFTFFRLQPKDDFYRQDNLQKVIAYCQKNPLWRLSLQTHKLIGIA